MIDAASYIGKRIGKYRIVAEISSHALNSVFQAEYAKGITAIKIMSKPLTTIKERERFFQEVRLLNMLKYPHILPILDVGIYDDLPYVVTEYMSNGSLRDYFDEQSALLVPLQETMYILLQIGQALNYAHQRNIIHGNLKPENVLFNEQGKALLTDFRIEAMLGKTAYEQAYKSTTYPYMAPEQFKSMPSKASDQYALGCIAYEAFTGQVPFTAADYKTMARKHAHESPIVPTQHNLLLPGRSEEAILKAMAKQSTDRFMTVKDLLQALSASITFRANMLMNTSGTQNTQLDLPAQSSQGQSPASSDLPKIEMSHPGSSRLRPLGRRSARYRLEPVTSTLSSTSAYAIPSLQVDSDAQQSAPQEQNGRSIASGKETIEDSQQHRVVSTVPTPASRLASTRATQRVPLYKNVWLIAIAACVLVTSMLFSFYLLALIPRHAPKNLDQVSLVQPTIVLSRIAAVTPVPTIPPFPTLSPTIMPPPALAPGTSPTPSPTPQPTPATPTPTPTPSPTPIVMLTVTPTALSPQQGCTATETGFRCIVTLSLSQNYQSTLRWSASSNGVFATFTPQRGMLIPGASVQVVIHVYGGCPSSGSFFFSSAISRLSVAWSC